MRLFGCSVLLVLCASAATLATADDRVLWRVGLKDNSSAEFVGTECAADYQITADWASRRQWPEFAPHVTGHPDRRLPSDRLDVTIGYDLAARPPHGAVFRLKTVNASSFVTEVAVFSNGLPCGILQLVGTEGWLGEERGGRQFGNTHGVYIPPEFLRAGANRLRVQKLGQPYCRANGNYCSLTPDWLELESLAEPTVEPLHSRVVHIGSQLGEFHYNQQTLAAEPLCWQWLGFAYSGNAIRAPFWDNTMHLAPQAIEYLQTARDYNMQVILNYTHCMKSSRSGKPEFVDADGELQATWKENLQQAFDRWGSLVQYYEVVNEPCMSISDVPMPAVLAVAKYAQEIKPPHLKIAAPAWTYGGGCGEPKDWDIPAANRLAVERFCDTTNGHSYGNSYVGLRGSLLSTIDSYGREGVIEDGFPKEYINTEMGTHRSVHVDFMNLGVNHALNASMHDRIFRAHIGFCDVFLNFASFPFGDVDFRTIDGDQYHPETWVASEFEAKEEFRETLQDSRVQVFRRLALAYATHGRPLPYVYVDEAAVRDRLVYFRAVDTSQLPPLPGSGGRSNKILLNFVNFSDEPQTMAVRVSLPQGGVYSGVRFGAEDQYLAARSEVSLHAAAVSNAGASPATTTLPATAPQATLTESLGPGDAIQYILEYNATQTAVPDRPQPPAGLAGEGGTIGKIGFARLRWQPLAEGERIKVQRSVDGRRFVQVDEVPATTTAYDDASKTGPEPGHTYFYRLKVWNAAGDSAASPTIEVKVPNL